MPAAAEQRDDVVEVALGLHVHQVGRFAVDPQRAGRHHGAFDAQRALLAQHFAHRQAGHPADLEVLRNVVDEGLDLLGGVEPRQGAVFGGAEAEQFAAGSLGKTHRVVFPASRPALLLWKR